MPNSLWLSQKQKSATVPEWPMSYRLFFLCFPLLAFPLPFVHPSNPLSPKLAGLWTRALLPPWPTVKPSGSGVNLMNIPGLACQLFNDFWKGGLHPASHFLWPSETQFIWLDWLNTHTLFLVCMNLISRITVIGRAIVMWLFIWQVDTMCHYIQMLQLGKCKWWLYSFTTQADIGVCERARARERENMQRPEVRGREITPLQVLHHPHCRQ